MTAGPVYHTVMLACQSELPSWQSFRPSRGIKYTAMLRPPGLGKGVVCDGGMISNGLGVIDPEKRRDATPLQNCCKLSIPDP